MASRSDAVEQLTGRPARPLRDVLAPHLSRAWPGTGTDRAGAA
jgi:hypothetical protein